MRARKKTQRAEAVPSDAATQASALISHGEGSAANFRKKMAKVRAQKGRIDRVQNTRSKRTFHYSGNRKQNARDTRQNLDPLKVGTIPI